MMDDGTKQHTGRKNMKNKNKTSQRKVSRKKTAREGVGRGRKNLLSPPPSSNLPRFFLPGALYLAPPSVQNLDVWNWLREDWGLIKASGVTCEVVNFFNEYAFVKVVE